MSGHHPKAPEVEYFFAGSLPALSVEKALDFVEHRSAHLPFVPQLPELHAGEDMIVQMDHAMGAGQISKENYAAFLPFMDRFQKAPRIKVQFAGPLSLSQALGQKYASVQSKWILFWNQFVSQLDALGYRGELWVQIDEPFWSTNLALPTGYGAFLCGLRGARKKTKVGLHNCQSKRPEFEKEIAVAVDFLSMDYSTSPMTQQEKEAWRKLWSWSRIQLIHGTLDPNATLQLFLELQTAHLWHQSPCGLYGKTEAEIDTIYPT